VRRRAAAIASQIGHDRVPDVGRVLARLSAAWVVRRRARLGSQPGVGPSRILLVAGRGINSFGLGGNFGFGFELSELGLDLGGLEVMDLLCYQEFWDRGGRGAVAAVPVKG
jgi:hypothetical protein